MSEHLKTNHEEHEHSGHHEGAHVEHHPKPEHHELSAAEKAEKLEAIHKTIEKEAKSTHELPIEQPEHRASTSHTINKGLKTAAFDRVLSRTRKQLSAPDRLLSRVVHQPAVDAVSNAAEKTVARPLPILSAGLFALIGSTFVLIMAKRYGFTYNLGVFFALFVVGFAVGLLIDLLRLVLRRRSVR